jgi:hypothetical protein
MATWEPVSFKGADEFFRGLMKQMHYLKTRIDEHDEDIAANASGAGHQESMNQDEMIKAMSNNFVSTESFSQAMNLIQSMKQEIAALKEENATKDEVHATFILKIEELKGENFALKSSLEEFEKKVNDKFTFNDVKFEDSYERVTNLEEHVDIKFGDCFSTMRATEQSITETVDAMKKEMKQNSFKVHDAVATVHNMKNDLDLIHHQFEDVEKRQKHAMKEVSNLHSENKMLASNVDDVRNLIATVQKEYVKVEELTSKADKSALVDKADVSALTKLHESLQELKGQNMTLFHQQQEKIKMLEEKHKKRLDFLMNSMRDLQKEAEEQQDEDARLKCLACNRPIGNMGEDTPYEKEKLLTMMEPRSKKEGLEDASPERRRPVARGPGNPRGLPFTPSGEKSRKDIAIPKSSLVHMYAQPIDKDPLTHVLSMPVPATTMTDTLRTSASLQNLTERGTKFRGITTSASMGMDGYVTVGHHLNFVEMTGAIAGYPSYPSLSGGLIPDPSKSYRKRPGTAPARRSRTTTTNQ